jgi:hypothetical protein
VEQLREVAGAPELTLTASEIDRLTEITQGF